MRLSSSWYDIQHPSTPTHSQQVEEQNVRVSPLDVAILALAPAARATATRSAKPLPKVPKQEQSVAGGGKISTNESCIL